ncbi:RNA polymerase II holoenzyme cyclin-like subunit [Lecanosticta acicola]|uniref:RNA polymerase II holoenzyme cyclin-like subunit n=1 Tax=Lecanosticta acicola TaxID=111012 RepID=A0AAI8YXY8_9PEZI|nr:RNA polymerase II holoenzyme cyclin-like subunit [Lecanosticta acicola]
MAANYWDSTQSKFWTFTKAELADRRKEQERQNPSLHSKYPLPDRRLMNIFLQQQLIKLGRRMALRQQALATAQMYVKRFYLRVEMRKTNPYLIMATAVYLACKMEECPQHIRLMLGEAARQWPELAVSETSKIGECEFALISTLSSQLICHHPYRTLSELSPLFALSTEENQLAHSIINDSYNTDLQLLYPPHVVAITAVFLAVVLRPAGQPAGLQAHSTHASTGHTSPLPGSPTSSSAPGFSPSVSGSNAHQAFLGGFSGLKQAGPKLSKLMDWLAESRVDMNAIVDATQEMVSLYDLWESYSERACKEGVTKFVKDGGTAGSSGVGAK